MVITEFYTVKFLIQVDQPLRCHLGGSPTCKMPHRELPVHTVEH